MGANSRSQLSWDEAVQVTSDALSKNQPGEIAFLLGLTSDHLADLVAEITSSPWSTRHLCVTALSRHLKPVPPWRRLRTRCLVSLTLPFFDIANADVTFSFGANFLETYHSPVGYARGFAAMRQGNSGKRGYLVQFEPRMSQTAVVADEWIPVIPGTQGLVALAIGRLIAEAQRDDPIPPALSGCGYRCSDCPGFRGK